jgi:hypothetical protein
LDLAYGAAIGSVLCVDPFVAECTTATSTLSGRQIAYEGLLAPVMIGVIPTEVSHVAAVPRPQGYHDKKRLAVR